MRIITETQLEEALEKQRLREYDMEGDSGETIIQYIMDSGAKRLPDIMNEVKRLTEDHQLRSLVDRGFLSADIGENATYFSLTEKGKLGIQALE